jgi:hypothetical protein
MIVHKSSKLLTRKRSANHIAKRRKKNPQRPKPEEKDGMPQHQHCPLAKHRGDKNPKYHRCKTSRRTCPSNVEREKKYTDE